MIENTALLLGEAGQLRPLLDVRATVRTLCTSITGRQSHATFLQAP